MNKFSFVQVLTYCREEYIDNHVWYDADIKYLEREMIVKI